MEKKSLQEILQKKEALEQKIQELRSRLTDHQTLGDEIKSQKISTEEELRDIRKQAKDAFDREINPERYRLREYEKITKTILNNAPAPTIEEVSWELANVSTGKDTIRIKIRLVMPIEEVFGGDYSEKAGKFSRRVRNIKKKLDTVGLVDMAPKARVVETPEGEELQVLVVLGVRLPESPADMAPVAEQIRDYLTEVTEIFVTE